jgi:tRNA-2-methylthio-N6-dimethylallyladenosine synthase
MNRVFIKTYGCQMNERDSEALAAMLHARGYRIVHDEAHCDILLLNTCSVRDTAEQKAIAKAAHLARDRKRDPRFTLGILGCMAQSRGAALLDRLPDLDLIIGTQKLHQVPAHLDTLRAAREIGAPIPATIVDTADEPGSQNTIKVHYYQPVAGVGDERPSARTDPTDQSPIQNPQAKIQKPTAYVSIQQGCNMACTFCIVPATRGDERSRPIDDIVAECRELAARGTREITLLGQIVTSYGRREHGPAGGISPFARLIERLHEIDTLARIRFTSPHPRGFKQDLVDAFAPGRFPKLCEHIHLPLQSGSDRILRAMNRPYTRDRYRQIIDTLRAANPAIHFSTDIIVGFPGETDADFAQTRELFEACDYDMAYIFKYSPRTGTPAAAMDGQVPEEVKERRNQLLLDHLHRNSLRRSQALVGTTQEILVEGPDKKHTRQTGRTRGNRVAIFEAPPDATGKLLPLQIETATASTLYGKLAPCPAA